MSNPNPNHSTVKHTPLDPHRPTAAVAAIQTMTTAGTTSVEVQASPLAKQALANAQAAGVTLNTSVSNKLNLAAALLGANKTLKVDFLAAEVATRTYESTVNSIAGGDASVITKAGCLVRAQKTPAAALGVVKDVKQKLGKAAKEAVVSWPEVMGATSYAVQVNFTPGTPAGPFTALPTGSSRRRVITAPAQGAQFLVQVAAISSDGTQSAWCDSILATAR